MRSIWPIRTYLSFFLILGWASLAQASWLDRQLEKAKSWAQFYKNSKGGYSPQSYVDAPDWNKGLAKHWIGVADDHTVFLAHGELFYAGGTKEAKSLKSFEKVKNAPKIKDIIGLGPRSYAVGEEGKLYQWEGLASGELSSLSVIAEEAGDVSSALWTSTPQGLLRVDNHVATFYDAAQADVSASTAKQITLPAGVASITSKNGKPVFLMNNGYVVHGDGAVGAQFSSDWGDAVSLESTNDAVWVLTESGSVWRLDESGSTPLKLDAPLKEISAGSGHVLGLDETGHVWSWGKNTHGQLGRGDLNDSSTPAMVEGLHDIIAIAAGYEQSFALSSSEGLSAWGNNASGQLGIPNAGNIQLSPQAVHIVGAQYLSTTSTGKAPLRIYFPQTGAIVGAPFSF